jgi:hypothetical protein
VGELHAARPERRAQRPGLVLERGDVAPLLRGVADGGGAERGARQGDEDARPLGGGLARRAPVEGHGVGQRRWRRRAADDGLIAGPDHEGDRGEGDDGRGEDGGEPAAA